MLQHNRLPVGLRPRGGLDPPYHYHLVDSGRKNGRADSILRVGGKRATHRLGYSVKGNGMSPILARNGRLW
jgi:hypothetical protein